MEKIAFVCQRYGLEVNGGAELLCRLVAERLTAAFDVTVYTTCATDYISWANVYPRGEEILNGVRVIRFPVVRERNRKAFGLFSRLVLHNPLHLSALEEKWIDMQGPYCPEIVAALAQDHGEYRAILFMTYLYYTTVRGMYPGLKNAFLIPTVHDEPTVYLKVFDRLFSRAAGFVWNSPEERTFALKRFPFIAGKPEIMAGVGIEVPASLPPLPDCLNGIEYVLYSGRIDAHKGCDRLFEYFLQYKKDHPNGLKLVLTGKGTCPVPKDPDIISLGFVEDEVKYAVMTGALAFVLFSPFESLSMVVLESMAVSRPVIVNGDCEVLRGHCRRSGAGLAFSDYDSFVAAVEKLRARGPEYLKMCENGKKYVNENYQWDRIIGQYRKLICQMDSSEASSPYSGEAASD